MSGILFLLAAQVAAVGGSAQGIDPRTWSPWSWSSSASMRAGTVPGLLLVGHTLSLRGSGPLAGAKIEPRLRARLETFERFRTDGEQHPEVLQAYRGAAHRLSGSSEPPWLIAVLPDGRPFASRAWSTDDDLEMFVADALVRIEDGRAVRDAEGAVPPATGAVALGGGGLPRIDVSRWTTPESVEREGGWPRTLPLGRLRLLLAAARRDPAAAKAAAALLESLARGSVRDQVAGGFHHLAREGWRVHGFQKRLADNALLLRAYAQAYGATGELLLRHLAEETVAWTIREMRESTGLFWTAQASTGDGVDGSYYRWTPATLAAALGPERTAEFLGAHALHPEGDFTLSGSPFAGLGGSRDVLLARRNRRIRPAVDERVVTAWNGMMIGALATSGSLLKRGADVEAARRAAIALWDRVGPPRALKRLPEASPGSAVLEDYAFLAEGLLDLSEASGDRSWRGRSIELVDAAITRFWEPRRNAFFDTDARHGTLFSRPGSARDGCTPSATAVMAGVLIRLDRSTGDRRYGRIASQLFSTYAASLGNGDPELMALGAAALE